MTTCSDWMAYSSALLTPVVAIFASYIAWQQWRTAKNKLKFDLFTRRFSVYDAARSLLAGPLTNDTALDKPLQAFATGTREARWLFDKAIHTYLREELWAKAIDLQRLTAELDGLPPGDERTAKVHERAAIKKWFNSQHEVLDAKFEPFLTLEH
jgi:hypothetical protein